MYFKRVIIRVKKIRVWNAILRNQSKCLSNLFFIFIITYHAIIRSLGNINGCHANHTICSLSCFLIKPPIIAVFLRENLQDMKIKTFMQIQNEKEKTKYWMMT